MVRKILALVLSVTLFCALLCPSAAAAPSVSECKQEIYTYLTDPKTMNCSPAVACGIMAGIQVMSSYNPEARNPAKGDTINTFGLCQWTGTRFAALKLFDPANYMTVNAQMRFLNYEMLTAEKQSWSQLVKEPNTIDGAYAAGVDMAKYYLRITQNYGGKDQYAMAGDIARQLYTEKTGISGPVTPGVVTPPSGTGTFLGISATAVYREGMFLDVTASAWFASGVKGAVTFGLMKGVETNLFAPAGEVTVAEAVTMAARLHCIYTNGKDTIPQSSGVHWYTTYWDYAKANGILSSASVTMEDAYKSASRAQVATILVNALPASTLPARNTVSDNAIPDVRSTASYAPAVYKLYRAGVLTGSSESRAFLPWNSITRAEIATIMTRMASPDSRVSFTMK